MSAWTAPRAPWRCPGPWIALLAIVLALAFLGSRGIWDPDEGRYTNVALNMLDSGDWLNPRRNDEIGHWTKPPLTYWAIAASIAAFGQDAFAARLPAALAYLACIVLVALMARRLVPGRAHVAALAYATMLLPFGAAQLITTDFLLAAFTTLAMAAFVEARFGARHRVPWMLLMWLAFALGVLTKGPPALLPLLPMVAFDLLMPGRRGHRLFDAGGIAVFALVALPWYVAVIHGHPGLLRYFLGDEVVGRLASSEFRRHAEWYGWIEVYAPTLLLGSLPWAPVLLRWTRGLPARLRAWRDADARVEASAELLLALWLLLPLALFCLARSRMPLYLLPMFSALALLVALQSAREARALPRWPWIAGWAALLLTAKFATAHWPTHKNAEAWARGIRARAGDVDEVVFVEDMARYGLHLHLGRGVEIEKIALDPSPQPVFNPTYDEDLATELGEHEPGALWITKRERWPEVRARIEAAGYRTVVLGTPVHGRVMFRLVPTSPAAPAPPPR
ncbi:ArnT family glycosyltransferase [Lysobacter humi (ex Lee et al. 2017)]